MERWLVLTSRDQYLSFSLVDRWLVLTSSDQYLRFLCGQMVGSDISWSVFKVLVWTDC